MRMYCLKGTELQLGKIKKFWRWMAVMLHNHIKVLNTNCILKKIRMVNFILCIFATNKSLK